MVIDRVATGIGPSRRRRCWLDLRSGATAEPFERGPWSCQKFRHPSCSSTVCGCTPPAGAPGSSCSGTAGYEPIAPGWPNEPRTVAAAREHPELVADIGIDEAVRALRRRSSTQLSAPPVIVGHSFGGLIAEKLLGQGIGAAARRHRPGPDQGRAAAAARRSCGPACPRSATPPTVHRAVSLTKKEFRFGFGNAVTEEESDELFEPWTIPVAGKTAVPGGGGQLRPALAGRGRHRQRDPRARCC